MITLKEIISCLAGVIVLSCVSHCRPNQNEKLVKTASAFAQDQTKLPWLPGSGGVMFLPQLNAFLIPAESLIRPQTAGLVTPVQPGLVTPVQPGLVPPVQPGLVTPAQPPKRRRPIANFIKYVSNQFPLQVPSAGSYEPPNTNTKSIHDDREYEVDDSKSRVNLNKYYGSGVSFYSAVQSPAYSYEDFSPKISELDRTLSENDRLLEKISEGLDETTMLLMGKATTRLTLKPVAKAVAGPRGVAVASPIAQAVLRRKDPAPEISYEPDSVAVAGPGGQAYSHPKLVVTYIDDLVNDTMVDSQTASPQETTTVTLDKQPENETS